MKILLVGILLVFCAELTVAQIPHSSYPKPLQALNDQFQRDQQRAIIPIIKKYIVDLNATRGIFEVRKDDLAIKVIDQELQEAQKQLEKALSISAPNSQLGFRILSAKYGSKNQAVDVTGILNNIYRSGTPEISVTNADLTDGKDPAPYQVKYLDIVYFLKTRKFRATFQEGHKLNFSKDLNESQVEQGAAANP